MANSFEQTREEMAASVGIRSITSATLLFQNNVVERVAIAHGAHIIEGVDRSKFDSLRWITRAHNNRQPQGVVEAEETERRILPEAVWHSGVLVVRHILGHHVEPDNTYRASPLQVQWDISSAYLLRDGSAEGQDLVLPAYEVSGREYFDNLAVFTALGRDVKPDEKEGLSYLWERVQSAQVHPIARPVEGTWYLTDC